ncbi:MAG: nitrite reductase [Epsilonproteobacteria bacterium]|nr:nitrite reductase [Campylobacterota bacterium]
MKLLHLLVGTALLSTMVFAKEKIFVVERETSSLAVIEDEKLTGKMPKMHNMNHGVVKFEGKDGYLISRDGYVVWFDPKTQKNLAEYKTSKSAIGFVIGRNYVAVANYDDKSVDILSRSLEPITKIKTGSKNVGIKIYKEYIIFAQMDNDKVTVLKDHTPKGDKPDFKIFKEFENIGEMPFDAMIKDNHYIVGLFITKQFGVVDLDTMQFSAIKITAANNKQVLKVPHFGFWSIGGDKVFIPAVGDNKVLVYDRDFKFIKNIETEGLPVFTSLSPDKKYMAVTYSGKKFPVVQIIDTTTLKIVQRFEYDGKVLHLRWSKENPYLYISINDTNRVVILETNSWKEVKSIANIEKPSGIFIYEEQ